jgi:hypothetical protein
MPEPDTNTSHNIDAEMAHKLVEGVVSYLIESGYIQVEDRSIDDIRADLVEYIDNVVQKHEIDWRPIFDYQGDLLERAAIEADNGRAEIAVVLYVTWLEHFINGILIHKLERHGYSEESVQSLIRNLNLNAKATALWEIADLPPLSESNRKLLFEAVERRNAFVHYKWRALSETAERELETKRNHLLANIGSFIDSLNAIQDKALWSGRRDEILEALRPDTLKVRKEDMG